LKLATLKSLDLPITAEQALALGLIDSIVSITKRNYRFDPRAKTADFELKNISPPGILELLEFFDKMRAEKYPQIKIFINPDRLYKQLVFTVYELIRMYPQHITTIGVKNLFRQTSLLLLAGDRRQMYYNAKFSIPEPEIDWDWVQLSSLDIQLGRELALKQLNDATHFMRKEFLTKTKLTPSDYAQLKTDAAVYDARTALNCGIIHDIILPKHLKK
jgi:ATP-dependent protease ClpP protease subunit